MARPTNGSNQLLQNLADKIRAGLEALIEQYDVRLADRPGYNRRTVYVLNRKGEVSYTDLRFRALEPDSYRDLGRAVADARQGR